MRDHWGDNADEALNCIEATLDEWWGGGSKEMTDDSRQHAMSALYFVRKRMTELRAERDEVRQQVFQLEYTDKLLRRVGGELEDERGKLWRERDEARQLARWLYRAGGQEALDVSGASDTSEWPWLLEDQ